MFTTLHMSTSGNQTTLPTINGINEVDTNYLVFTEGSQIVLPAYPNSVLVTDASGTVVGVTEILLTQVPTTLRSTTFPDVTVTGTASLSKLLLTNASDQIQIQPGGIGNKLKINTSNPSGGDIVVSFADPGALDRTLLYTDMQQDADLGDLVCASFSTTGTFTATNLTATGVVTAGSVSAGSVTSSGAISGASLSSTGSITGVSMTASGAISGASVSSSGALTAGTATISGAMNAASATVSGAVSAGSLSAGTVTSTGSVTAVSVTASGAVSAGSVASTGAITAPTLTTTGAVTAGSFSTTGGISAASLTTTGDISANDVTASGTVTAADAVITGTVTIGNLATGNITSTGTITAQDFVAIDDVSVGGTLTAVDIVASGDLGVNDVTATGTVSAASLSSSGAISGATLTTTGAISGANLTVSGVASSGSVTTGSVTATSVAASGAITAASLTTTGTVSAASVSATGAITAATMTATGDIAGDDIQASGQLRSSLLSSQLALRYGSGTDLTLTCPTLAAARTYTLEDAGADTAIITSHGSQTVNGNKTFLGLVGIGTSPSVQALRVGGEAIFSALPFITGSQALVCNFNCSVANSYSPNTDATDASRIVQFLNAETSGTANRFSGASFHLTGSGTPDRVIVDLKAIRETASQPNGALVITGRNNTTGSFVFRDYAYFGWSKAYISPGAGLPITIGSQTAPTGGYYIALGTAGGNTDGHTEVNGNAIVRGTLTAVGATSTAALSCTSLTDTGNATIDGTLGVTGATTLAGVSCTSLTDSGNATVGGTLTVTGTISLAAASCSSLTVSGNASVGGDLTVTGAGSSMQKLQINDDLTVVDHIACTSLGCSTITTSSDVTVGDDLTVTGDTGVGGFLGVSGPTYLQAASCTNLTASGDVDVAGILFQRFSGSTNLGQEVALYDGNVISATGRYLHIQQYSNTSFGFIDLFSYDLDIALVCEYGVSSFGARYISTKFLLAHWYHSGIHTARRQASSTVPNTTDDGSPPFTAPVAWSLVEGYLASPQSIYTSIDLGLSAGYTYQIRVHIRGIGDPSIFGNISLFFYPTA